MVNSGRYGGCSAYRAGYTTGSGPWTAAHELGHLVGGLADEYEEHVGCGQGASEVNTSLNADVGAWPEWISVLGKPREGAQYYTQCVYRPLKDCTMRHSMAPYCPVCVQQLSLRIFENNRVRATAPIESTSPPWPLALAPGDKAVFSVGTRFASSPTVKNSITWKLQSPDHPEPVVVSTGGSDLLQVFPSQGTCTVTCVAAADENLIKPEKAGENVDVASWSIATDFQGHAPVILEGPASDTDPAVPGAGIGLSVTAEDDLGHDLVYAWQAACPPSLGSDGSLSDATTANPIWKPPSNTTGSLQACLLQVSVSDGLGPGPARTVSQSVLSDIDTDGIPDISDNCPRLAAPLQGDLDADGTGDACDFTLLSPTDGAEYAEDASPPIFSWTAGDRSRFQVQFATTSDPFKARIVSRKKFVPGVEYFPEAGQEGKLQDLLARDG